MTGFNPLKVAFDVVTSIPKTIISIPGKVAEHREELERRRKLEEERRATPPSYDVGVSEEEFEQIVLKAKKGIPRIKTAAVKASSWISRLSPRAVYPAGRRPSISMTSGI